MIDPTSVIRDARGNRLFPMYAAADFQVRASSSSPEVVILDTNGSLTSFDRRKIDTSRLGLPLKKRLAVNFVLRLIGTRA